MPRSYSVTRKGRAAELLKRVTLGPAFSDTFCGDKYTPKHAANQYRIWVDTWVLPAIQELIPELKRKETLPHESTGPKV